MKLFYISKYAATSLNGNPSRQFMLSKYINKKGVNTKLIYSRSNGDNNKRFYGLYKTHNFDELDCVQINGVLVKMGVNLKRLFSWVQFEINLFIYFLLLPKSQRPDVVIASSFSLFTFITVGILKYIYKFKMVVEIRDLIPQNELEFNRISEKSLTYKVFKFVEMFGLKHADKFVGTMPKLYDYLVEQNISNPDTICIPQGFDREKYKLKSKGEENYDSFVVMYSGTIGEVNLVEEFCVAADLLKNEKIEFIIYGDGPLKKELQLRYSNLEKLSFKGRVSREKIVDKLLNADLLVNMWADIPMYKKYGVSPNKWVDYMLAAKPILVSYNGYRTIINEANCGWFIEANNPKVLADKILELSKKDKSYLAMIGENGKKYALKNLDYEILAEQLLDFILKE